MKFVMVLVAMVYVLVNFWGKNCALRRKTRGKHLCKGRIIILTAKMACVATVEQGNCLLVPLESFESEK